MRFKHDPITKTKLMNMVDVFYRCGPDGLRRQFTRKDRAEASMALRKVAIACDRTTDPPLRSDVRQVVAFRSLQEIEDSAVGQECKRLGIVEFDAGPTEAKMLEELSR